MTTPRPNPDAPKPVNPFTPSTRSPKEGELRRDTIAQALFLFDHEDCSVEQWKGLLRSLETEKFWAGGKHNGDCTNEPFTCNRCLVEDFYKEADAVVTALAALPQEPTPSN